MSKAHKRHNSLSNSCL